MIKVEKELSNSERRQLNEYIQNLTIIIEETNKNYDLHTNIPGT